MANPGSSGTAFNMVSTILQMMGEDEGFKFLAGDEQERQPVHALRQRRHPGGCEGRDDDRHHIPARLGRADGAGLSGEDRRAVRRYRLRDHLVGDHQERSRTRQARASGWTSCCRRRDRTSRWRVNKFQMPSNRNAQVHPMAPKPSEIKLIKLDLDKYGSKQGRERLLSRWENEVFKAPK